MPGDFCRFRNDRDCRSAYFLDAHLVIVWVSYGVEVTMSILNKNWYTHYEVVLGISGQDFVVEKDLKIW